MWVSSGCVYFISSKIQIHRPFICLKGSVLVGGGKLEEICFSQEFQGKQKGLLVRMDLFFVFNFFLGITKLSKPIDLLIECTPLEILAKGAS